jgi:hypothetical protein
MFDRLKEMPQVRLTDAQIAENEAINRELNAPVRLLEGIVAAKTAALLSDKKKAVDGK